MPPHVAVIEPGLGVGRLAVGEAGDHVVEPDPRQDGHAVPLALAVVGALVAEGVEGQRREGGVGQLGLLHAHHVGLHLGQPLPRPAAWRTFSELTFQVAMRTGSNLVPSARHWLGAATGGLLRPACGPSCGRASPPSPASRRCAEPASVGAAAACAPPPSSLVRLTGLAAGAGSGAAAARGRSSAGAAAFFRVRLAGAGAGSERRCSASSAAPAALAGGGLLATPLGRSRRLGRGVARRRAFDRRRLARGCRLAGLAAARPLLGAGAGPSRAGSMPRHAEVDAATVGVEADHDESRRSRPASSPRGRCAAAGSAIWRSGT